MQFMRLRVRRSMKFGMRHSHRAETGNSRHQRLFFRGEYALLARVDENRALGARGAERRGNQHSRRNQIAQRVHIRADRKGEGLSRSHRALRQVCRKAQRLPVVAGAHRSRQLRRLRRNRLQFKRSLATQ